MRCSSSRREARGGGRKPRDAASGSKGRKEQGDEVVWDSGHGHDRSSGGIQLGYV